MTLPDGYVSYGPWLAAHMKSCPGEAQPKVIAKVKRRKKREKGQLPVEVDVEEFAREAASNLMNGLLQRVLDSAFKGK